jgi:diaminopimelate decarboxylase
MVLTHDEIESAARHHGTPLYLYEFEKIKHQYSQLRMSLGENFEIYYALKANPNPSICCLLAELGCGADVSSMGELQRALETGFPRERIIFTGPGKTPEELTFALTNQIYLVVIESLGEAKRLNSLAKDHGLQQKVLVRINPYESAFQGSIKIGSSSSKFGIDEEAINAMLPELLSFDCLQVTGVHIYSESNILDHHQFLRSCHATLEIANRIRESGLPVNTVDFGGGIGVPYDFNDTEFNGAQFGLELNRLLSSNDLGYHCIFEIGRYLTAESGYFVMQVVDTKVSRGQRFVILNGGIHHLFRPLLANANKLLQIVNGRGQASQMNTFVGPLLTPSDVIVNALITREVDVGDLVVIYNCGAYSFNHSLAHFHLHSLPAEAYYDLNRHLQLSHDSWPSHHQFWLIPSHSISQVIQ